MPYTPYYPTWEDDPSTDTPITAAALNNIEDGIAAAIPSATATTAHALVWNGSAWVGDSIRDARIASDAAISISKLAGYPSDSSKALLGDGTWGTAGAAAPGYGTSLPGSPTAGQEYILVDSTTAPTYQWRLRYNASASGSNKWEYIGGAGVRVVVSASENIPFSTTNWQDCATVGPDFTVPRAGIYRVEVHVSFMNGAATIQSYVQCGLGIGAWTTALWQFLTSFEVAAANSWSSVAGFYDITCAASDVIRIRYLKAANATVNVGNRTMVVTPIRLA